MGNIYISSCIGDAANSLEFPETAEETRLLSVVLASRELHPFVNSSS